MNSYLALAVGFFGVEGDAEIFVERWGGGVERASGAAPRCGKVKVGKHTSQVTTLGWPISYPGMPNSGSRGDPDQ